MVKKKSIKDKISWLAFLMLFLFALLSNNFQGMQQISLYICVPSAFILSIYSTRNKHISICLKLLICLYLWEFFTFAWAVNQDVAGSELFRLLGCFAMVISFYTLAKREWLIPWLYMVYVLFYLGLIYYAQTNLLTDDFDYTEERLGDNRLNANMLAYFSFFTTYIIYIFPNYVKNKYIKKVLYILFLLSPIWSFGIALLTASRQVLIIQFPFIAVLLYFRYLKNRSYGTVLASVIIGLIALVFLFQRAEIVYENSMLQQRNEMEVGEDTRAKLIEDAVNVGIDHPFVGVGPGNFGLYAYGRPTFSHSTYFELLANNGLPGLLLFCTLIYVFVSTQYRRYRLTKKKEFLYFFIFGLFYAIDNLFYVFHTAPWLISFLFLVDSHSYTFYKKLNSSPHI